MMSRPLNVSERIPEVGDVLFMEYVNRKTGRVAQRRTYMVKYDNRPYDTAYPGFTLERHQGRGGYEIGHFPLEHLRRYFAYCSRADGGQIEM